MGQSASQTEDAKKLTYLSISKYFETYTKDDAFADEGR